MTPNEKMDKRISELAQHFLNVAMKHKAAEVDGMPLWSISGVVAAMQEVRGEAIEEVYARVGEVLKSYGSTSAVLPGPQTNSPDSTEKTSESYPGQQ